MNESFNNLPWHDATIQSIKIDREHPGDQDTIKFLIIWPEEQNASTIEFTDCYALNMNMNFGIVALKSILHAECFGASEKLNVIRNEWSRMGVNLENLKCFRIETNSTNSIINIYALGYRSI